MLTGGTAHSAGDTRGSLSFGWAAALFTGVHLLPRPCAYKKIHPQGSSPHPCAFMESLALTPGSTGTRGRGSTHHEAPKEPMLDGGDASVGFSRPPNDPSLRSPRA